MSRRLAAILIAATCGVSALVANADVDLSQLTYAGTGCAAGGSGISYRRNSVSGRLLVYLPDMSADLSASTLSRKVCSLALPVSAAADERIVIGRPAVWGAQNLAADSKLNVTGGVFFAGGQGPSAVLDIAGQDDGKVQRYYQREDQTVALGCGESGIIRARAALLATKSASQTAEDAPSGGQANLSGIAFDIHSEKCTAE